jgi:prepilin-type processing-associated H-X9-DG protein
MQGLVHIISGAGREPHYATVALRAHGMADEMLRFKRDGYPPPPNWIPASEPPDHANTVQIAYADGRVSTGYFLGTPTEWIDRDRSPNGELANGVTHWKPLSPPPGGVS